MLLKLFGTNIYPIWYSLDIKIIKPLFIASLQIKRKVCRERGQAIGSSRRGNITSNNFPQATFLLGYWWLSIDRIIPSNEEKGPFWLVDGAPGQLILKWWGPLSVAFLTLYVYGFAHLLSYLAHTCSSRLSIKSHGWIQYPLRERSPKRERWIGEFPRLRCYTATSTKRNVIFTTLCFCLFALPRCTRGRIWEIWSFFEKRKKTNLHNRRRQSRRVLPGSSSLGQRRPGSVSGSCLSLPHLSGHVLPRSGVGRCGTIW